MITGQKTVTTTATLLVASDPHDQTVLLHSASGTCYLGNANVTTSTGFRIDNGDKLTLPLGAYEGLYAVATSGTVTVYVYSEVN